MPTWSDSAKYSGLSLIPTAVSAALLWGILNGARGVKGVAARTFSSNPRKNYQAKWGIMIVAFIAIVFLMNMLFMHIPL